MTDILRDPAWQAIGIFIGGAIALWIYRAQRSRPELSFGVLSSRALVSVHSSVSKRIAVTLDERPVRDPHIVVMALKNSGNTVLRPEHFHQPVEIQFGVVTILSAEVTRREPANLEAQTSVAGSAVYVPTLLLNPGEFFVIQVLTSGGRPSISCAARVEGISRMATLSTGVQAPNRSFESRLGRVVLLAPVRALMFWFLASLMDAIFKLGLIEAATINGSLAFGLLCFSLLVSILEEASDWLRQRWAKTFSRTISDA